MRKLKGKRARRRGLAGGGEVSSTTALLIFGGIAVVAVAGWLLA